MNTVNNKGFSLLELIVAIAIIAIAGTTLFNGFVMSGKIHMNTTQLQMAEDVAQQVAEDFNAQYVDNLKTQFSSLSGVLVVDNTDADKVRTVKFTNVPYSYGVRSGAEGSSFLVDIELNSIKTAGLAEVVRDTTYKQNSVEEATFFAVNNTVGTNTFIVPEVTNIYDGKCTVVAEEINQHDNVVVSDLHTVLRQQMDLINLNLLATNQIDVNMMDGAYSSLYVPLTNITSDDALKKKTEITIKDVTSGDNVKYYYIVTVEYEFNFDFPVYNKSGIAVNTISNVIPNGDLAAITSAEAYASSYSVKKSGNKYTVRYEKELSSVSSDLSMIKGSFAGAIIEPLSPDKEYKKVPDPTSSDKIPYIYFIYKPFDLYSDPDNGECNDEIEFKYEGSTTVGSNIVRAFLVEQKVELPASTDTVSVLKNCKLKNAAAVNSVFKLYTNSTEIIEDTSSGMNGKNYLTNSYGKSRYNFYDMKITVKDLNGNTVAVYDSVKEE